MSRIAQVSLVRSVASSVAHRRVVPSIFFFGVVAALVTACGSSDDGSGGQAAAGAAGAGGTSGSTMMPSSSTGGGSTTKKCDERRSVCVQACPGVTLGVSCTQPEPCPAGFTVDFACGADPSATPIAACAAGSARTGAFCAKDCPATTPASCDESTGLSTCGDGWIPIMDCAAQ